MIGDLLIVQRRLLGRAWLWVAAAIPATGLLAVGLLTAAPLALGTAELTMSHLVYVLTPATYSVISVVVLLGQDVASGAVGHLLDTPVPRWRLSLHTVTLSSVVSGVLSLPVTALTAAAQSDGGVSLTGRVLVGTILSAVAYSCLAVGVLVLSRRDIAALVVYIVAWELVGTQFFDQFRAVSICYSTLALAGAEQFAVPEPLPDLLVSAGFLLAVITAGPAAATIGLRRSGSLGAQRL